MNMNAKEIREQFNKESGMIAHQSPWAYAKWIEERFQAKSKEEAGISDGELDKLAEAYSKEILPHEKEGSLARTQLEVGFIDGYRAASGKEGEG